METMKALFYSEIRITTTAVYEYILTLVIGYDKVIAKQLTNNENVGLSSSLKTALLKRRCSILDMKSI